MIGPTRVLFMSENRMRAVSMSPTSIVVESTSYGRYELFREFRQGNTITQANPALRAESVFGAEIGVDYVGETIRAGITFYRGDLSNLITNVTLVPPPAQTVRHRPTPSPALAPGAASCYPQPLPRPLPPDLG